MKDLKISKELLNEILKRPVEIIDIGEFKCMIRNSTYFDNEQSGVVYSYLYGNKEIRFMSIYEFAFKCKEWALTRGYFIYSTNELSFIKSFSLETIETFSNGKDTEIECILKACEWILNEQNNDTK